MQHLLVAGVDALGHLGDVVGGGVHLGGDQLIFGVADAVEHFVDGELFVVQIEVFEGLLDHLLLIGRIENNKIPLVAL